MLVYEHEKTVHQFFVNTLCYWPSDMNGDKPVPASKNSIRRWLENKAILLNGKYPKPNDEMPYPITELVFFPKSPKRRTTMVYETSVDKFEDLLGESALYKQMDIARQIAIDEGYITSRDSFPNVGLF